MRGKALASPSLGRKCPRKVRGECFNKGVLRLDACCLQSAPDGATDGRQDCRLAWPVHPSHVIQDRGAIEHASCRAPRLADVTYQALRRFELTRQLGCCCGHDLYGGFITLLR